MLIKNELEKSLPNSKNELYRTLIAVVLFSIFGFIESRVLPWGLGIKAMLPLVVTWFFLGGVLGKNNNYNLEQTAIHGAILGIFVYGIVGSWLQGVGAYHNVSTGIVKFLAGVLSVIFVSLSLKEISRFGKIEN